MIVNEVYKRIADMENDITTFIAITGIVGDNNSSANDVIGSIQLEYNDWRLRKKSMEIIKEVREKLAGIPGIIIQAEESKSGPQAGKDLQLRLSARNADLITDELNKVKHYLEQTGNFIDIEDSETVSSIEWKFKVDRKLASFYGIDITTIGTFIRMVTNGMLISSYRPDYANDEVDILLRFPEDKRHFTELTDLKIVTSKGAVPISNFVEIEYRPEIGKLTRTNGFITVELKANLKPGVIKSQAIFNLNQWLKESADINPGVKIIFKGDDENQAETSSFLQKAFILSLAAMTLVLIIQFNSIYHALIIVSAIFLSTGGVFLALLTTGQTFGIVMCGVGIISLAGIVVNNNIIFIENYRGLVSQGLSIKEALLRTGVQRIRAILLTAGTTILGLIPMVIGMNIQFSSGIVEFGSPSSQWWNQLSTAIAGGLSFATILTLFFTPALLMIGSNAATSLKKFSLKKSQLSS